jgi:protein tyrosine/serine phosphatase
MMSLGKMDAETRADQAAAAVYCHRAMQFDTREISQESINELMVNLLYLSREHEINPVIMFCRALNQYEEEIGADK